MRLLLATKLLSCNDPPKRLLCAQNMFLLAAAYAPRLRALAGLDADDLAFRVAMRAALRQTAQAAAAKHAPDGQGAARPRSAPRRRADQAAAAELPAARPGAGLGSVQRRERAQQREAARRPSGARAKRRARAEAGSGSDSFIEDLDAGAESEDDEFVASEADLEASDEEDEAAAAELLETEASPSAAATPSKSGDGADMSDASGDEQPAERKRPWAAAAVAAKQRRGRAGPAGHPAERPARKRRRKGLPEGFDAPGSGSDNDSAQRASAPRTLDLDPDAALAARRPIAPLRIRLSKPRPGADEPLPRVPPKLGLKLRLSSRGTIPQVDGTADDDEHGSPNSALCWKARFSDKAARDCEPAAAGRDATARIDGAAGDGDVRHRDAREGMGALSRRAPAAEGGDGCAAHAENGEAGLHGDAAGCGAAGHGAPSAGAAQPPAANPVEDTDPDVAELPAARRLPAHAPGVSAAGASEPPNPCTATPRSAAAATPPIQAVPAEAADASDDAAAPLAAGAEYQASAGPAAGQPAGSGSAETQPGVVWASFHVPAAEAGTEPAAPTAMVMSTEAAPAAERPCCASNHALGDAAPAPASGGTPPGAEVRQTRNGGDVPGMALEGADKASALLHADAVPAARRVTRSEPGPSEVPGAGVGSSDQAAAGSGADTAAAASNAGPGSRIASADVAGGRPAAGGAAGSGPGLSDAERRMLPALAAALRGWLADAGTAAEAPRSIADPHVRPTTLLSGDLCGDDAADSGGTSDAGHWVGGLAAWQIHAPSCGGHAGLHSSSGTEPYWWGMLMTQHASSVGEIADILSGG